MTQIIGTTTVGTETATTDTAPDTTAGTSTDGTGLDAITETAVQSLLRRHLPHLPDGQDLASDAPLRELGLDSMQAVELVFDLEDEIGIIFPDEAMTAETFATLRSLLTVVAAERGDAEGVPS